MKFSKRATSDFGFLNQSGFLVANTSRQHGLFLRKRTTTTKQFIERCGGDFQNRWEAENQAG